VSVCSQWLTTNDCHRISDFQATACLINSEITCQYLGLHHLKRVFRFFSKTLFWNVSNLTKNWASCDQNVYWSSCTVSVILSNRLSKDTQISYFKKVNPVKAKVVPCGQTNRRKDGQTDRHDEANYTGQQSFCFMRKNFCFWYNFVSWIQIYFQNFSSTHSFHVASDYVKAHTYIYESLAACRR